MTPFSYALLQHIYSAIEINRNWQKTAGLLLNKMQFRVMKYPVGGGGVWLERIKVIWYFIL